MSMIQNGGRTGGRGNVGEEMEDAVADHMTTNIEYHHHQIRKNLDSNEDVLMLTFGSNTNFAVFKDKLGIAYLEKYGNL